MSASKNVLVAGVKCRQEDLCEELHDNCSGKCGAASYGANV